MSLNRQDVKSLWRFKSRQDAYGIRKLIAQLITCALRYQGRGFSLARVGALAVFAFGKHSINSVKHLVRGQVIALAPRAMAAYQLSSSP